MVRILKLVLAATVAVMFAPTPADARPLVPAGFTDAQPHSDGEALVWEAAGPALARRVPGSGRTTRVALRPGCALEDVSEGGFALLTCPGPVLEVLETRTGRLLARYGVPVRPRAPTIGGEWLEGLLLLPCAHCEEWIAINWRTGQRRSLGPHFDKRGTDLDRRSLRPRLQNVVATDGRTAVTRLGGEDHFRIYRDGRHARTVREGFGFEAFSVDRDRVAWLAQEQRNLRIVALREIEPVSGRRRSWSVDDLRIDEYRARVLHVGSALFLAVPDRPRAEHGRYRVLRAR